MKYNIQSMVDPIVNFGKVVVSTGYDDLDTVVVLEDDNGSKLPNPYIEGPFNLVWYNSSDYADPSDDPNREIVRVTIRDGDVLTVTRAQEGTGVTPNVLGHPHDIAGKTYKMILSFTKKAFTDIRKIPDYYSKIPDIPEFQTWMKNRLGHLPDTTITGAADEEYCFALTFDGTYIWAGLLTAPVKILKINPIDNSYTVITGTVGENYCTSLTFDGTYVWAGLDTSPFKMLKINPVYNSYTVITGTEGEESCYALTFDGTYIWAGLWTTPAKILKINPIDNSYTVITGVSGENYCFALAFDGTYIWAGLDISPFKILRINPIDNSYTVITGTEGEDLCEALTFDGTYIWAGLWTTPAKILKINPVDNSYTVITGAEDETSCASLTFDGTYIWAGLFTNPVKILRINPVDDSYIVITGVIGEEACYALTFDGTYIWAGLYSSPFKILKKFAHLRKADIIERSIKQVSSDTTLDETYYTVLVDAYGGNKTINLPTAVGIRGRIYNIKKIDNSANLVIIDAYNTQTIDGTLTKTLTIQYESLTIQSDNVNWFIV